MRRGGVIVFVVLLGLIGTAMMFAAYLLQRPLPGSGHSSVLVFDVPYMLEEGDPPPSGYVTDWLRPDRLTLWRVVGGLRRAARDHQIEALVLHIDHVDWGWAKVAEVRDAIQAFREEGKPIYASVSGGGEREYLLASSADYVTAPPLTVLQLDGLTASALFWRGTLDKLDIRPNFAQSGTYKSGAESATRKEMSGPAREALQALLDDLYADLIDSLAVARGLDRDTVARLLDDGPYGAEKAWVQGLIDTLMYRADLDSLALEDESGERDRLLFTRYLERPVSPGARPRIALVVASGTIYEGRSYDAPGEGLVLGSATLIKALKQAREKESIKAIVLRIDSPGGSAPASDEIWREVQRCREHKPVVASMSDVAASGGYYVAAAADSIVARSGTITGSIGVYGGKLNVLGLYQKLGLNVETLSRGAQAEMLSPFKDFNEQEASRFQESMETVYRTFVARVSDGRGLTPEEVEAVAQGRVWSGVAAAERALVDDIGGIPRAVDMAKSLAKIPADEEVALEVYPKVERTFLQRLLSGLFNEEDEVLSSLRQSQVVKALVTMARFPSGEALTLLPYHIEIR